ncbi:O-antigen ligase family protein [Bacillus mycoides]|uniref:O-antigen ligase family protein n=1 Tax=Bacillus mycoides TaxID=1405 RepID=UPI001F43AF26|nr:O-antigen ligase family protein [Bacillus mycoides]
MNKIIVGSIFFFSFFLIMGNKFNNTYIYPSSVMCFIYIMYTLFNLLKVKRIKINITKQELTMIVLLIVYMLFTLVTGLYMGIENKSIYKVYLNNLYIITFIVILIFFKWTDDFSIRFSRIFSYTLIFMGIMGIFLYIKGIYGINITFTSPFFTVYDENTMMRYFNEVRLQSIFSQKTKYAFYCLTGMFLLNINPYLNVKIRWIGITILAINVVLTNSMMSLVAMAALIVTFINYKKINKYFRYLIAFATVFGASICSLLVLNYTSNIRDLSSWGSRKYIWEGALDFLKQNPYGVIDNWYLYRIDTYFQGAHNVFLNEFLDYGIIGGSIFLLLYFLFFYNLFKIDKRTIGFFLATTILFMVDNVYYWEIIPVFWFSYLIIKIFLNGNEESSNMEHNGRFIKD